MLRLSLKRIFSDGKWIQRINVVVILLVITLDNPIMCLQNLGSNDLQTYLISFNPPPPLFI